jgi:hypothetical protein
METPRLVFVVALLAAVFAGGVMTGTGWMSSRLVPNPLEPRSGEADDGEQEPDESEDEDAKPHSEDTGSRGEAEGGSERDEG